MLYRLGEDVISRLILPLNDAEDKEAVREIARKKALKNAEDKDSQEICFIEDGDDYKAFLRRNGCDLPKGCLLYTSRAENTADDYIWRFRYDGGRYRETKRCEILR